MLYDKDIREPLFDYLEELFPKLRIFEEKNIRCTRADVMAVTEDALIGLEIKSDADGYARLSRQTKDYDRFFDLNYVVVGKSHAKGVVSRIPGHWGIITVSDEAKFETVREAAPSPKVKMDAKLSFMWKSELSHLLSLNALPKYKQKSKRFICLKLAEKVDHALLSRQISNELFERDYTVFDK